MEYLDSPLLRIVPALEAAVGDALAVPGELRVVLQPEDEALGQREGDGQGPGQPEHVAGAAGGAAHRERLQDGQEPEGIM